jgi:hypothetical protein
MAANIAMSDPMRARMGLALIVTRNPHVAAAVPALITADPHIPAIRGRTGALDNHGRRPDANHDLSH